MRLGVFHIVDLARQDYIIAEKDTDEAFKNINTVANSLQRQINDMADTQTQMLIRIREIEVNGDGVQQVKISLDAHLQQSHSFLYNKEFDVRLDRLEDARFNESDVRSWAGEEAMKAIDNKKTEIRSWAEEVMDSHTSDYDHDAIEDSGDIQERVEECVRNLEFRVTIR